LIVGFISNLVKEECIPALMTICLYIEEYDGSCGRDSWKSHGENAGESGYNEEEESSCVSIIPDIPVNVVPLPGLIHIHLE
jgi:hypothetical protein